MKIETKFNIGQKVWRIDPCRYCMNYTKSKWNVASKREIVIDGHAYLQSGFEVYVTSGHSHVQAEYLFLTKQEAAMTEIERFLEYADLPRLATVSSKMLASQLEKAFDERHGKFWAKKIAILLKGMVGLGNRITKLEVKIEVLEKHMRDRFENIENHLNMRNSSS